MTRPPHVAVIADARFPIAEPFAGGLQSMTWHLVRGLRARGVPVTVCAAPGSESGLATRLLDVPQWEVSDVARQDVAMPAKEWLQEHHAYLDLMMTLSRSPDVDVVHNNSLHHLPVAMAEVLAAPMVTTLHTPPTPWLESAIAVATPHQEYVAVSGHTADAWAGAVGRRPAVVYNGVDLECWPEGPGGDGLVWTGRLCPEKGAHLAIDIARRAGLPLTVAGPVSDPAYWREQIAPRLGEGVTYAGHLDQQTLAALVGRSAACLVTPLWDEPYGLVAAEALACGTPVVGFACGGVPEVVDGSCARLVPPGDVEAAAAVVADAIVLDRAAARDRAVSACGIDQMVDTYLELYAQMAADRAAA